MDDIKVHWEISFDRSMVSLELYAKLLLTSNVEHLRAFGFDDSKRRWSATMMVRCSIADMQRIERELKPTTIKYRSPTRCEYGTIISIYQTPEDEIAAIMAQQREVM